MVSVTHRADQSILTQQAYTPHDNFLTMTPADYLSWLPQHDESAQGFGPEPDLWLQMGGSELPIFGRSEFDDTWTASGFGG